MGRGRTGRELVEAFSGEMQPRVVVLFGDSKEALDLDLYKPMSTISIVPLNTAMNPCPCRLDLTFQFEINLTRDAS